MNNLISNSIEETCLDSEAWSYIVVVLNTKTLVNLQLIIKFLLHIEKRIGQNATDIRVFNNGAGVSYENDPGRHSIYILGK